MWSNQNKVMLFVCVSLFYEASNISNNFLF